MHDSLNHTSILDDYSEGCSEATAYSYSTPNLRATSAWYAAMLAPRPPCVAPALFPASSRSSRQWMSWPSSSTWIRSSYDS